MPIIFLSTFCQIDVYVSVCLKNMREKGEKQLKIDQKVPLEFDYKLQIQRVNTIMQEAISKVEILKALPVVLENDGEVLRRLLLPTEADFIMMLAQNGALNLKNRPDLETLHNMLSTISFVTKSKYKVASSHLKRRQTSFTVKTKEENSSDDTYLTEVAYAVDIIFNSKRLIEFMKTAKVDKTDQFVESFQNSLQKLKETVEYRLKITAKEEVDRENDLKMSYRTFKILSKNIENLEEHLQKQRQELNREHMRKEAILKDIDERLNEIKNKAKMDISRIIYDSETNMMKEYNKSIERQQDLAVEAKDATSTYNKILEENVQQEKTSRAKYLKAEAQLASWVTKFDQDIGEKQAEYERIEDLYNKEKEEYDDLMDQFEDQERVYKVLMAEKEAEERRIYEEKAWIFLQNRSAKRIQRAWRAYKERKLARKKRRGKKGKKEKKAKKGQKGKKEEPQTSAQGGSDPNAFLQDKFDSELLADIKQENAFEQKDVVVDLNN